MMTIPEFNGAIGDGKSISSLMEADTRNNYGSSTLKESFWEFEEKIEAKIRDTSIPEAERELLEKYLKKVQQKTKSAELDFPGVIDVNNILQHTTFGSKSEIKNALGLDDVEWSKIESGVVPHGNGFRIALFNIKNDWREGSAREQIATQIGSNSLLHKVAQNFAAYESKRNWKNNR